MKIYSVGGSVRDSLLGINSNDLDYVMVLDNTNLSLKEGFAIMEQYMLDEGFEIFLKTEEMVTIRGKFPKGHKNAGIVGDFVLARRECGYKPNTRRPILELGTIFDDLQRRDFTVNAMAEDENGNIIDLFGGQEDLRNKVLRTPTDANITFLEDPLRILRGFRFFITKGFRIHPEIYDAMQNPAVLEKLKLVVSQERIREELKKMFEHDTIATMKMLVEADKTYCEGILDICFGADMWLLPTTKK